MKILITGANGQLGRELQAVLQSGKAQIGPIPDVYDGAEIIATTHSELDVSNMQAVDLAICGQGCDLIINCAGMTNVDACETDIFAARQANSVGPQLLSFAARRAEVKLVHISTDYVFSGAQNKPYVETDLPDPKTAYGRSKLEGELFVSNICPKHFIFRTSWLYGLHGKNFVKTMLQIARENGAIKVVDDQRGNPTYANDLAYEILKVAATENYGTYHASGNGVCSWFDLACAAVDLAGIQCNKTPCGTEEFPRPAKRPAYSALDNKHLRDTVGDEMRPWREALVAFIDELREAGEL